MHIVLVLMQFVVYNSKQHIIMFSYNNPEADVLTHTMLNSAKDFQRYIDILNCMQDLVCFK